ncbi:VOC family protein [Evansella sp. AB-P1]|uniref:VOC family protein n=1 Tax=Evansella sp. AB-P1 TaxID=3037653 RepID=UPI00241EEEAA|nr:VOC family protein [Evansella sp. AB-P1]MDG5788336.1 VOC family protein [Evansella sp. AB-P1]
MEKKYFQKPCIYVGEVNINVMDLEKSVQFYQQFIGFSILEKTDSKAILTADGSKPLLTLNKPKDVQRKQTRTTGLYHFAILLPSRVDLSSFFNHVVRSGYEMGASDHFVSEALYISDPDGNGIEVYRDRPSSEWSWSDGTVSMATEPLDGQSLLAESDEEWNGLPKDSMIGHIHLHVSELEKTEKFYTKGLGFDVVTRYPGALFISTGGYHHHIGLNVWNGIGAPVPEKNSVGLQLFTLEFPDEESRQNTVHSLKKIGATVTQKGDIFMTEDPSKNCIVLR